MALYTVLDFISDIPSEPGDEEAIRRLGKIARRELNGGRFNMYGLLEQIRLFSRFTPAYRRRILVAAGITLEEITEKSLPSHFSRFSREWAFSNFGSDLALLGFTADEITHETVSTALKQQTSIHVTEDDTRAVCTSFAIEASVIERDRRRSLPPGTDPGSFVEGQ